MDRKLKFTVLLLPLFLLLCACAAVAETPPATCRVVLEDSPGYTAETQVLTVERGADAVFALRPADGFRLTGADYPDYTLSPAGDGSQILTIRQVRYSTIVTLETRAQTRSLRFEPNGGTEEAVTLWDPESHLRMNTLSGLPFTRPGYTLTGWNTSPDGSGTTVGLGSRIGWEGQSLTLYAQWEPWTAPAAFTWTEDRGNAVLCGYNGDCETVCIPATLGGLPVISIAAGAFRETSCTRVVLPPGLRQVEAGAFEGCTLSELILFDDIVSVSDYAFTGCSRLTTLRLNALEPPVYSGGYFDTFQDKFDRLLSLAGEKKLVLFSGSSTRFGYDSAALEQAFPDYSVVNMGVFAYTNALPQLLLILDCMEPGDILLHAPEFDAAQRQFCTRTTLDAPFFAMMESNYDTLARLDLRNVNNVFTALNEYLTIKSGMRGKSYDLSPAWFDEDGAAVSSPSYNEFGDYCLFRPDAPDDTPVYGLEVSYTVAAFPREQYIEPLNAVYRQFLERDIRVFFTYAPRNAQALSPDSTPQARAALDACLRDALAVPVISPLEDSLYPGRLLFGTDNHLSTHGVEIRTRRVINDLRAALGRAGDPSPAANEKELTP